LLLSIPGAWPRDTFWEDEITCLTTAHAIVTRSLHGGEFLDFTPHVISGHSLSLRLAHFHLDFLVSQLVVYLERVSLEGDTNNLVFDDLRHDIALDSTIIGNEPTNTLLENGYVFQGNTVLLKKGSAKHGVPGWKKFLCLE
jgi:hypothetical protein